MEFRFRDYQNQRASAAAAPPPPLALPSIACVSGWPIQGFEFGPRGFPINDPEPSVFPGMVGIYSMEALRRELEKEEIRRELEKEEIRREIIMSEMALARRKELEEEVKREMVAEGIVGIPIQRPPIFTFPEPISMPSNPTMAQVDNNGWQMGQDSHPVQANHKYRIITLAKPDAATFIAKRKAVAPSVIDGNEDGSFSLQKKPKKDVWRCTLCRIFATSEKGLNDHLQGKKHKSKQASRIPKIGLDSRFHTQNTGAAANPTPGAVNPV